tara:strand:+ start:33467 stop:34069 length:603 start_codon:yes stop_codon:yes gene_type:complete
MTVSSIWINKRYMKKIRYNKSKTYLLPLLSELVDFDIKFYKHLINTYIAEDTGKYEDCLIIEHEFSFKVPEFTKYEQQLIDSELFVDSIDVGDKVLYVFKFPEEYMHEYNCFKAGKYSQYKKDAKELILEFFTTIYRNNLNAVDFLLKVKHILFKNKRLKEKIETDLKVRLPHDAELTDRMEEKDETYKLSKIKKKEKKE